MRDFGTDAGTGQQHFDGKCGDSAESAYDREAKQSEQDIGDRCLAQRAEKQDEDSSAGRCSTDGAQDHCHIKRDRSPMQIL